MPADFVLAEAPNAVVSHQMESFWMNTLLEAVLVAWIVLGTWFGFVWLLWPVLLLLGGRDVLRWPDREHIVACALECDKE